MSIEHPGFDDSQLDQATPAERLGDLQSWKTLMVCGCVFIVGMLFVAHMVACYG